MLSANFALCGSEQKKKMKTSDPKEFSGDPTLGGNAIG